MSGRYGKRDPDFITSNLFYLPATTCFPSRFTQNIGDHLKLGKLDKREDLLYHFEITFSPKKLG